MLSRNQGHANRRLKRFDPSQPRGSLRCFYRSYCRSHLDSSSQSTAAVRDHQTVSNNPVHRRDGNVTIRTMLFRSNTPPPCTPLAVKSCLGNRPKTQVDLFNRMSLRLDAYLMSQDPSFVFEGHTGHNPEKVIPRRSPGFPPPEACRSRVTISLWSRNTSW